LSVIVLAFPIGGLVTRKNIRYFDLLHPESGMEDYMGKGAGTSLVSSNKS